MEILDGKTPLEVAGTSNMDMLATEGTLGIFKSVPEGYPPGSDVANLSILGYDPKKYYTGRSPLEAASIGVELGPEDVAFRCNLVSLSKNDDSDEIIMHDYSAGHISTEEGGDIMESLNKELSEFDITFYKGTSYRHLMVWHGGKEKIELTPPHDISDRSVEGHLPTGDGAQTLLEIMEASQKVLFNHPVNEKRRAEGKNTADSVWLWGHGRAPVMETFEEKYKISGSMISAVDLMNGMGIYAGLEVLDVPGMTGYIDTNYAGKVEYALNSLKEKDFVCVHVEAPDEAGHQGSLPHKLQAIEDFDAHVVGKMIDGARKLGDFNMLVLPDHYTPVELKTHTSEPVPFVLFKSREAKEGAKKRGFTEKEANASGVVMEDADQLSKEFFS
ncbi:MAG: cofactor-independent phosphoglycerate mutase [Proteobacteria bacterium]|nr:cofactor-independent phosphoglycerate mutase [Pseudomonadota bacterium]